MGAVVGTVTYAMNTARATHTATLLPTAAEKKWLVTKPNPDFLTQVKGLLSPNDTLLVMCRSGGRSKKACDLLAQAGFKEVYNIVDGMEGDEVKDSNRPDVGKRTINGWKNAGLPWTYALDTNLRYLAPKKYSGPHNSQKH